MNVAAFVNHGRWVVNCPSERCHAAIRLLDGETVACDCTDDAVCDHMGRCDQPIAPILPRHATRIEAVLLRRPQRDTRNWLPGETVAHLQAENLEHGVRI